MRHIERHRLHRIGWLRAAVLGANDGIVATASLIVGVAAADAEPYAILLAGVAGVVAGAMSMAAGEYVSVSSQADTEKADLAREQRELDSDPEHEHQELKAIYINRGLDEGLANEVARQFMENDALRAHARDELGINVVSTARPVQAAMFSAIAFAVGGALPLAAALLIPTGLVLPGVVLSSLVFLALLGAVAAFTGGAPLVPSVARVSFWGAVAMAVTALVGHTFGVLT